MGDLRGRPTCGVTGNSFGARWFDMDWKAHFDQPAWKEALTFVVNLMNT